MHDPSKKPAPSGHIIVPGAEPEPEETTKSRIVLPPGVVAEQCGR